jgi:hypothetical protein
MGGLYAEPKPVLWLNLQGEILVAGEPAVPEVIPAVQQLKTAFGVIYDFDGQRGGIRFPDRPEFRIGGSMTASAWIYARSYVNHGPGAQVLFRGDDRSGLDPYDLVVHSDGTINFHFSNDKGEGMHLKAELPLNDWCHVTANLDVEGRSMNLYVNGDLVGSAPTTRMLLVDLDPAHTPGTGVGNTQNPNGPHNQPFNGRLADVRLYGEALTPEKAGFSQEVLGRLRGIKP